MPKLTFENPPESDDPSTPTRDEVARALSRRSGRYAIVGRHDRAARAARHAERIASGTERDGYEAVYRQVGPEHRVYVRHIG